MDIKLIFVTLFVSFMSPPSLASQAQEGIEICDRLIAALEKKEQTEEVISAIKYVSKFKEQLAHERAIKIDENILSRKYLSDISFSSNDYILNTLLNLIPKKIYIHTMNDTTDEFINTIKLIFEDRVSLCNDCSICKIYKKSHAVPN